MKSNRSRRAPNSHGRAAAFSAGEKVPILEGLVAKTPLEVEPKPDGPNTLPSQPLKRPDTLTGQRLALERD
jgi:hypothetical protein